MGMLSPEFKVPRGNQGNWKRISIIKISTNSEAMNPYRYL